MNESLPFSQACENNKDYILAVLKRYLQDTTQVLEIGGGTGQHAAYFAGRLPNLVWQSTDMADNVESLNRRLGLARLVNLPPAYLLDVTTNPWNCGIQTAIFTANSLHIMAESAVKLFFEGIKKYLADGGMLLVYGPFKYNGEFTTDSNASFDLWLKDRDPVSGIRDFETVQAFAKDAGLSLLEDNAMPANNQLLVWQKTGS